MADQNEKVSREDESKRRLVYQMAHTVLVSCDECRDTTRWQDRLSERLQSGGWALSEKFFIRESNEEVDVYSYFCPEGHFTDGYALSEAVQVALHRVFSEVIEPLPQFEEQISHANLVKT